jgi:hypothetical protein
MLLRRIIEHVREQAWTAITIDFVIVVVGVYIGIQVANWNQARVDERRGGSYVLRLKTDLERDLEGRRTIAAYYGAVLESVERANALLADPEAEPEALLVDAYRASEIMYVPPSRATWDEVVSSGDTGLLPRDWARGAAEYFAFDTARNTMEILSRSAYRHRVRSLIPLTVQKAIRAGCSDRRDEFQQIRGFMADCTLDIDAALVAATSSALRGDPVVQEALRQQYSDVSSAHANVSGDVAVIEQTLASLDHRARNKEGTP